ncbi:helix-turn-helix transcriptional regulator [Streptomyces sp. NBC_01381]|uniref:winged helix-turn-helix transcriptional regulator n=1 Tax=unclassified Streptomyces TaxID=2593676 RepID=UPI00225C275A|nr:helix-turn-helix domain-containing protein [Streptomyces sp. NBC_01381]MCX4671032.1 helix-turn-helix transcriptional regulator [Streptomyces sp. NBC_01381]
MSTPLPGRATGASTTGRPLMAALDLFGRRWSLRIVWELRADPLGFRALRERCDAMSSSVLRQRLTELLEARLVQQLPDSSYTLTALGREAHQALMPLDAWARRWATEVGADSAADRP